MCCGKSRRRPVAVYGLFCCLEKENQAAREALARIFEYIKRDEEKMSGAKIPYEHWNYGEPTEAGKGWLHEYIKKHSLSIKNVHYKIQPVYGEVQKNKIKVAITGKGDFTGTMQKSVKLQ